MLPTPQQLASMSLFMLVANLAGAAVILLMLLAG